ncbi:MAG: AtpZ/AtpI family protein [Alphaproteobacteria bacterium]|nr:AtpZ/AtpI family protein [Alphaproteobacteria bacterium]
MGMRVGVELVSGTAVGGFIGYSLDKWLGTMPLFFLICLILGIAAGGLALYKLARQDIGES